jgi:hypothetical protein
MLETRFAPDSLLEGTGFEPSVPQLRRSSVWLAAAAMQPEPSQLTAVNRLPRSEADRASVIA